MSPVDRREFFGQMAAAPAVGLFAAAFAEVLAQRGAVAQAQPDIATAFWGSFFDGVDKTTAGRGDKKETRLPNPDGRVHMVHSGTNGLRLVEKIQHDELPDISGNALVTVSLGGMRIGSDDEEYLRKFESLQLRLDCVQTEPIMQYLGPLGWASLAAVFRDKAGKLPTLQQLEFRSSPNAPTTNAGINRVVLPSGRGKLAFNIGLVKKESRLHAIFTKMSQVLQMAAPLVPLPAISIPALRAFTDFYTQVSESADYLMNDTLQDVVATKEGLLDSNLEERFIHLLPGEYVLVAQKHATELAANMDQLRVLNGYLIRKDSPENETVQDSAKKVVPRISYLIAKVAVTEAPAIQTTQPTPVDQPAKSTAKEPTKEPKKSTTPPTKKKVPAD